MLITMRLFHAHGFHVLLVQRMTSILFYLKSLVFPYIKFFLYLSKFAICLFYNYIYIFARISQLCMLPVQHILHIHSMICISRGEKYRQVFYKCLNTATLNILLSKLLRVTFHMLPMALLGSINYLTNGSDKTISISHYCQCGTKNSIFYKLNTFLTDNI